MMKRVFPARLAATLVVAAMATPAVPLNAEERTIRCESKNYRYRYCPVDTDGRVRLERELSRRECDLWRSWGYDRRGVWVDRGCRAEFRVGESGGIGTGGAIAIGAVASAAILAAILAHKNSEKDDKDIVPEWAVGHFRGWDDYDRVSIEMAISPEGGVAGHRDEEPLTGRWENNQLRFRGQSFDLRQAGDDGIVLTDRANRRHTVSLYRTW